MFNLETFFANKFRNFNHIQERMGAFFIQEKFRLVGSWVSPGPRQTSELKERLQYTYRSPTNKVLTSAGFEFTTT